MPALGKELTSACGAALSGAPKLSRNTLMIQSMIDDLSSVHQGACRGNCFTPAHRFSSKYTWKELWGAGLRAGLEESMKAEQCLTCAAPYTRPAVIMPLSKSTQWHMHVTHTHLHNRACNKQHPLLSNHLKHQISHWMLKHPSCRILSAT